MSIDKNIINDVVEKIKVFQNTLSKSAYECHPLDSKILSLINNMNSKLCNDDDYSLFKQIDIIKEMWGMLIEKSIICLRYYDEREPFKLNANKKPRAYGVDQLCDYFNKYSDFESMLYGGAKYYRDHVIHVFRVWLLGIRLLLKDNYIENVGIQGVELNQLEKISIWTIIALTHDLGYPLEKALQIIDRTNSMMKTFVVNPAVSMDLSFTGVQNSMNDFVLRLISSKMKPMNNGTNEQYVARLQPKYYFKFQKSLEHNKHGVLSALIIYKILLYFLESDYNVNEDYQFSKEDARQFYIRREILRAIASHTCSDIYQLDATNFSFLLIVSDDAQDWGRKSISELYTINNGNRYSFKKVEVKPSQDKTGLYKCLISDNYEISDVDLVPNLIKRFINQGKSYRDIFRDGQDTTNRNFDFSRITGLDVNIEGDTENFIYKLVVPNDSQAKVTIEKKETLIDANDIFYKKISADKGISKIISIKGGVVFINLDDTLDKYL